MEFQLEDLEDDASEDDLAAGVATASATNVAPLERKRPMCKPSFDDDAVSTIAFTRRGRNRARVLRRRQAGRRDPPRATDVNRGFLVDTWR